MIFAQFVVTTKKSYLIVEWTFVMQLKLIG